jgi:DNA-binding MurR/RpiR family transcriptional regulator
LRETVTRADFDRATDLLGPAQTIYLIGQRRAFSVSHYLAYALGKLSVRAMLIDNVGSLGAEQMANATPGDALIAISFAPYTPFTVDLTRKARERAMPIVVITDSPLSPLAGLADARFEIAESDFGSFRSLAATFCLAITLAVALAEKRDGRA